MQPAFTSVSVRPSMTVKTNAAPPAPPNSFSTAVVEYVQRAFFEFNRVKDTPAFHGITDGDIRKKLSAIVNEAKAQGAIEARDWTTWRLPHQFVQQERQQAALYVRQNAVLTNQNHYSAPMPSDVSPPTSVGQKRKSPDSGVTETDGGPPTSPWKKKENKISLADRVTGKSKKQDKKRKGVDPLPGNVFDNSHDALERRKQRFGNISPEPSPNFPSRNDPSNLDIPDGPIVGTCETLEKSYFRLTAPPHPSTVRPLAILEQALDHVISIWDQKHDYGYVCDQLKSIRQDLTVQRIKAKFSIRVYEVHARIALEMQDLGEYNQCQTQLRALYKLRLGEGGGSGGNDDEFLAYRILYLIYTNNRSDMNDMLADLTQAEKRKPFAKFALTVRAALAAGNYHKLFRLYQQSPSIGLTQHLMAMFIERERLGALAVMSKGYKPDVGFDFVSEELGFSADRESERSSASQQCADFISKYQGDSLLQQNSDGKHRVLTGKAGPVFQDAKRAAFSRVDIKGQI